MDSEIKNFFNVWIQAIIALSYCHVISSKIPKSLMRLISIMPVITLFLYLPLNLTSFHFTIITSAFFSWFCNFKLLLFAFDQGPLALPLNLKHFIIVASFPIKINSNSIRNPKNSINKIYQIYHLLKINQIHPKCLKMLKTPQPRDTHHTKVTKTQFKIRKTSKRNDLNSFQNSVNPENSINKTCPSYQHIQNTIRNSENFKNKIYPYRKNHSNSSRKTPKIQNIYPSHRVDYINT